MAQRWKSHNMDASESQSLRQSCPKFVTTTFLLRLEDHGFSLKQMGSCTLGGDQGQSQAVSGTLGKH